MLTKAVNYYMNKKIKSIKLTVYLLAILMSQKIKSLIEMSRFNKKISEQQLTYFLKHEIDAQNFLFKLGAKYYKSGDWYLLIDDTVIEKPYQKTFELFSWVFDHKKSKSVKGICIVYAVLTNGKKVIPLYYEVYQKGGPSRIKLALRILSKVRNSLRLKPRAILFDSWYANWKIFKRISDYGWMFVSQLKKNRIVDGKQIREHCFTPYQSHIGNLKRGLKVKVCRNLRKFFICNRITIDRKTILEIYNIRQMIEQFFKDLKSNFGLCDLSMHSAIAWLNHILLSSLAYIVACNVPGFEDNKPSEVKKKIVFREIPFGIKELNSILGI